MKRNLWAMAFISLFSGHALAELEVNTSSTQADYGKFKNNEFKSVFFTLGYRTNSATINHNETSSAGGFSSLDNETKVINDSIELGVMKEFFDGNRFSFSAFASGGVDTGHTKKNANDFDYSDTLSGTFYTYGASLNLNLEAFDMKIQPYVFGGMSNSRNRYVLKYKNEDNSGESTKIKYDRTSLDSVSGLGVRFIDPSTQLASYISVSQLRNISSDNKVSATVGDNSVKLNKEAKFSYPNYVISLGMGFFF